MAARGNHITPKSEKNVLQNAEYRERRNTY